MRILISGGKTYNQKLILTRQLNKLHTKVGITEIVHCCYGKISRTDEVLWGAHELAGEWARANGVKETRWPANKIYKRSEAMRDFQVRECSFPDVVLSFGGETALAKKHMKDLELNVLNYATLEPVEIK